MTHLTTRQSTVATESPGGTTPPQLSRGLPGATGHQEGDGEKVSGLFGWEVSAGLRFPGTGWRPACECGRSTMKLTGHKTRSVFERYNIVSDGDLADAVRKLSEIDRLKSQTF